MREVASDIPSVGTAAEQETATATMRAARIDAPRQVSIVEVPVPRPGKDDVRVRIEGCGVCASSLPVWEGRPWFEYPQEAGAPGHEGWGRVDAVGDDVTNVKRGDRVAVLSYNAFAEYDCAPAVHVVPLPEALGDKPVLGEPLGCAINIFERSSIQPGHRVAIIGIGFLGALLTALSVDAGASVVACSRRPYALDVARSLGADRAISFEEDADRTSERLLAHVDGDGYDRVIEATGKQQPLNVASAVTGVRGRLVIAGYHQDGLREVDMQQWNWKGLDVINAHERDPDRYVRGMRAAVDRIAAGRLDPEPLCTHSFALDAVGDAFEILRNRSEGFLKAWIRL